MLSVADSNFQRMPRRNVAAALEREHTLSRPRCAVDRSAFVILIWSPASAPTWHLSSSVFFFALRRADAPPRWSPPVSTLKYSTIIQLFNIAVLQPDTVPPRPPEPVPRG